MVRMLILAALLPVAPELSASAARYLHAVEALRARRAELASAPKATVLGAFDEVVAAWETGSRRDVEGLLRDLGLDVPKPSDARPAEGPGLYVAFAPSGLLLVRIRESGARLCEATPLPRCEAGAAPKQLAPLPLDAWLAETAKSAAPRRLNRPAAGPPPAR
jgi:hypothetical protein